MPFLKNGGLFLPIRSTSQGVSAAKNECKYKSSVGLLLRLLDDPKTHFCLSKIVWLSPGKMHGNGCRGIGLHFSREACEIKSTIETRLRTLEAAQFPSQTL
ncbi:MAG: type 4 fimbrial biogenesis protein PilZ [Pseudohongiella sp.]|nr:MAG: type 4 fimbrial biogenesis protein PilZ [Pseudohongiella sp.]